MNLNDLRKLKWQAKILFNHVGVKGTALAEAFKDVANSISILESLSSIYENPILYSDPKSEIWEEIRKERMLQDKKWGGAKHDDHHTLRDWSFLIGKVTAESIAATFLDEEAESKKWRYSMIKIAALAVAAIESYDRIRP